MSEYQNRKGKQNQLQTPPIQSKEREQEVEKSAFEQLKEVGATSMDVLSSVNKISKTWNRFPKSAKIATVAIGVVAGIAWVFSQLQDNDKR